MVEHGVLGMGEHGLPGMGEHGVFGSDHGTCTIIFPKSFSRIVEDIFRPTMLNDKFCNHGEITRKYIGND